jgi:hypothetical protein
MSMVQRSFYALLVFMLLGMVSVQAAERLKPFVLGSVSTGDMAAKISETKAALVSQGFRLVGEYTPYENAHVIIVTNDDLLKIAAKNERGGYAAVQRVSVTKVDSKLQVSYVNPLYIQYAYRLKNSMEPVAAKMKAALGAQEDFGSKKGLKPKKLKKYHYTFGMEYFNEPFDLGAYSSHDAAVRKVESGLSAKKGGISQVYKLDIPGSNMTLFGVSMNQKDGAPQNVDDAWQMGIIDFKDLKHTAYLPYDVLVDGKNVEALHMRFRAAMHFPDLSMAGENSFMKVMSSPGAIENSLWDMMGGKPKDSNAPQF